MSAALAVTVPLINPNENEARLAALHVKEGQKVKAGAPLATLETTKSTFELNAETAGYVAGLQAAEGDVLRAGALLCYLAPTKSWKAPKVETKAASAVSTGIPEGLRITQPALLLAQQEGLDLAALPIGPIITEAQVRAALQGAAMAAQLEIPPGIAADNAVLVYGGGGHGKAVIELIRATGAYEPIGVLDDGRAPGESVLGAPVLGGGAALAALRAAGCRLAANAVGGIGAMSSRLHVFERLNAAGFVFPSLLHPSAVVEPSARLGAGVQVFPHAYIGSDAEIGFGCIVNTGAIVSHDCVLAEAVNLAPGAILAGGVHVGEGTLVGMGVTVNLNVQIGAGARIGNSAVVKADVPDGGVVRAGAVWPS
ncbi:MAG: NeuD/PglB/VioB family sugar acetyltransferase [Anaerolineales bacterium]|nr:NeuD/PglB/VioB family sugar acetyltransferase [Anaerolineales bacterium]